MHFSSIDFSNLPPPDAVEPLDYETIYAARRARFLELWDIARGEDPSLPAYDTLFLETDPVAVLLQESAYRELLLRARVNDAVLSVLLARASGADLDNLAANYGVSRLVVTAATDDAPAVMEADRRLRRRVLLAIEAYSVAGPAGAYIYHALTAVPALRDATAISTDPGRVLVTIMGTVADPEPTPAQLSAVATALSDQSVRPLTDVVSVAAPRVTETDIVAALTIYPGPDGAVVQQRAQEALAGWLVENAFLGRDLRRSAIFSRLHVEGVQSVELLTPAADVVIGPREAIRVGAVTVTVAGVDE